MEIRQITNANYYETIKDILQNKRETIIYGIADDYVVLKGNNLINEEYCQKNNLEVYNSSNMGGTIVVSAGDVEFSVFRFDGWNDNDIYSRKMLEYLKTRINNIDIKDNDFLVDDKFKVGSFSSINMGENFIYSAFHFSVNVNLEHINNICTKPMNKIPKGLSEFGISGEEIKEFIEKTLGE